MSTLNGWNILNHIVDWWSKDLFTLLLGTLWRVSKHWCIFGDWLNVTRHVNSFRSLIGKTMTTRPVGEEEWVRRCSSFTTLLPQDGKM